MKKEVLDVKKQTANDITDVKDIRNNVLYTKSGYIIGFQRLYPINIELLTDSEIENLCNTLTAEFKAEKEEFSLLCIPRTVDMEEYLNFLSLKYEEEMESVVKKKLLNVMIRDASQKIMNGENFEHQYYIRVWIPFEEGRERQIKERLNDIEGYYQSIQNDSKSLTDVDIIKLCNLYSNSNSAVFEDYDDADYAAIPFIK